MSPKSASDRRRAPSQQRSRDTVAAIRQAAIQILVKEGYAPATTVRIAQLAGVSVGTLYQYFDGREAVFEAVTEDLLASLTDAAATVLAAPAAPTLRGQLHGATLAVLTLLAGHPLVLRRLDGIPRSGFRGRLVEAKGQAREIMAAFLSAHQAQLHLANLPLSARMLVDFAEGVAYNLQADDDIELLAAESANLMYAYLIGAARDAGVSAPAG